jgi:hypothetical protein
LKGNELAYFRSARQAKVLEQFGHCSLLAAGRSSVREVRGGASDGMPLGEGGVEASAETEEYLSSSFVDASPLDEDGSSGALG